MACRVLAALCLGLLTTAPLAAADADNCLMCHRFRGLARVEKDGRHRLFYIDEEYYSRGPHARARCTDCHADIDKIPHVDAQPVDCLRTCHIEEPNREILFTHKGVQDILGQSVHSRFEADGTPKQHADDLPTCKDCHEAPLFRPLSIRKTTRAGFSERALGRCAVCHDDTEFTHYFYAHVTSRLHKARDAREVVEMCARCHSDPGVRERHGLSNAVASFEETYHGKAILFGCENAADCMDCHVMEGESVHAMHARSDPRSSVHLDNRAATCASADCHPDASPALASFDVHATRNPETHPLEFGVALFFVLATLVILLPIITLNVFALLRDLFPSRRAEAEIDRLAALAHQHEVDGGGVVRFRLWHGMQHAFLITSFLVLCLTGFPMKFAESSWAPPLLDVFGGIDGAPIVHRVAGVAMMVGFGIHIIWVLLLAQRGTVEKGRKGFSGWLKTFLELPMIPRKKDLGDILAWARYALFLSPDPPKFDRFSWKEKLEYLGLFWGIPLLGVTGVLLWAEEGASRFMPGWILNVAYLAHTYEALLAVAHIILAHIPSVAASPHAFPVSSVFLSGRISAHDMAKEHGAEVERLSGKEVGV